MRSAGRITGRALGAIVLCVLCGLPGEARAQATPGGAGPAVDVRLELADGAVYEKGPFRVKLTFINKAEPRLDLPAEAFGPGAFSLTEPSGRPARQAASSTHGGVSGEGPLPIDGYLTTSRTIDLSGWYQKINGRGAVWNLTWQGGPLKSGPLRIVVVKAHDPAKDRVAILTTDVGKMTWRLLPEFAPVHVKRFVDLARQGFYDGLSIYRVVPGVQADGGDPRGDGSGGWENLLSAEFTSKLQPAMGLVGALRQETSMTSDSLFFITLAPNEFMMGKQTFFAKVTEGIDTVAKLNRVPNNGPSGLKGEYLTNPPVRIQRIEIR